MEKHRTSSQVFKREAVQLMVDEARGLSINTNDLYRGLEGRHIRSLRSEKPTGVLSEIWTRVM